MSIYRIVLKNLNNSSEDIAITPGTPNRVDNPIIERSAGPNPAMKTSDMLASVYENENINTADKNESD